MFPLLPHELDLLPRDRADPDLNRRDVELDPSPRGARVRELLPLVLVAQVAVRVEVEDRQIRVPGRVGGDRSASDRMLAAEGQDELVLRDEAGDHGLQPLDARGGLHVVRQPGRERVDANAVRILVELVVVELDVVRSLEDRGRTILRPDAVRDGPLVGNREDHDATLVERVLLFRNSKEIRGQEHERIISARAARPRRQGP